MIRSLPIYVPSLYPVVFGSVWFGSVSYTADIVSWQMNGPIIHPSFTQCNFPYSPLGPYVGVAVRGGAGTAELQGMELCSLTTLLLQFPINLSQFLWNKVDVMLETLHTKQYLHSVENSGIFIG